MELILIVSIISIILGVIVAVLIGLYKKQQQSIQDLEIKLNQKQTQAYGAGSAKTSGDYTEILGDFALLSKYDQGLLNDNSSINSRTMIITGTVILLFLLFHLSYIWYSYQTHSPPELTYYEILLQNEFGYLGHTLTSLLYIVSILLIASHLKHGFESALKTLGITQKSKFNFLYNISIIFWGIIPIGFIFIIICIQLGVIN